MCNMLVTRDDLRRMEDRNPVLGTPGITNYNCLNGILNEMDHPVPGNSLAQN